VLKWGNDCSWNSLTYGSAAYNGYLEVLKWAHENVHDWNSIICGDAACNGYSEVLKKC